MTPSSTSSSEAVTLRTWLCVNRPNQHALFLRTLPLSRYTFAQTHRTWLVIKGLVFEGFVVHNATLTISFLLLSPPWAPTLRLLLQLLRPRSSLLVPMVSSTGLQFLPITSSAPVPWFPLSLDQLVLVGTTLCVSIEAWTYEIFFVIQLVVQLFYGFNSRTPPVGAGIQLGMISKGSGSLHDSCTT